ncbi:hypothetical protein ACIXNI_20465 [Bacteroides fragilis]
MAKYNNTKYKGYDSIREYRRAQELKLLEKRGLSLVCRNSVNTSLFRRNTSIMK